MGLRFRKSISIIPGVKLNIGKTGMSLSVGVPGFRKTINTNGKVTTSVGIPGTGLYYVDTKNTKNSSSKNTQTQQYQPTYSEAISYDETTNDFSESEQSTYSSSTPIVEETTEQLDINSLKSIHKASDDTIDWTEVLVSPLAPDETYNQNMWSYYHNMAPKILAGDIDSYLQLIYEVNPLDDLLAYGSHYEFGTDTSQKIEVEFSVNENALNNVKKELSRNEYNLLFQDYVCSVCIRIARDMFALLPIKNTIVHAVYNGATIVSVNFDRSTLSRLKFGYIDPSDTFAQFTHNMEFDSERGFAEVNRIE